MSTKCQTLYLSGEYGKRASSSWRSLCQEALKDVPHYVIINPCLLDWNGPGSAGCFEHEVFALGEADACVIYLMPEEDNSRELLDLAFCVSRGQTVFFVCPSEHRHAAVTDLLLRGLETVHRFDTLEGLLGALKLASGCLGAERGHSSAQSQTL